MKILSSLSIVLLFFFLYTSCTKDKTPEIAKGVNCDSSTITFVEDVLPILSSNCTMSGCHSVADKKAGYQFTNYAGVLEAVDPGDADDSHIYESITGSSGHEIMPPAPAAPLSSSQIDIIKSWIDAGAEFTQCNSGALICNTSNVSYAEDISPIIQTNCAGCHSATGGQAPFLSSHAEVQSVALSGLLKTVVEQTGSKPMPPSPTPKLSDCNIDLINAWINAGALNN